MPQESNNTPEKKAQAAPAWSYTDPNTITPMPLDEAYKKFGFGEHWVSPDNMAVPEVYKRQYPYMGWRWCHMEQLALKPARGYTPVPKIEGDGLPPAPDGNCRYGDLILCCMPLTHNAERSERFQRKSREMREAIEGGGQVAATLQRLAQNHPAGKDLLDMFHVVSGSNPSAQRAIAEAKKRGASPMAVREAFGDQMDRDRMDELAKLSDSSGASELLDLDKLVDTK